MLLAFYSALFGDVFVVEFVEEGEKCGVTAKGETTKFENNCI
ncbi:hypothetical protein CDL12_26343 [Handroanthus impetiginosus]|uniref:Uncharacterized protein n=1 Tax=Handroanthus impetiginosus TaxID=429701 RepID=A0A2G9G761_9LAMI|nr:hypothetical protein CDL12_26343 [Handroanthus impetiginosus]